MPADSDARRPAGGAVPVRCSARDSVRAIERVLLSPRPSQRIESVLAWLSEVAALKGLEQGRHHCADAFGHTMLALDSVPAKRELRWAALLHDVGKAICRQVRDGHVHFRGHSRQGAEMTRVILGRLGMEPQVTERVANLVLLHMRPSEYRPYWSDYDVWALRQAAGDQWEDLLALTRADIRGHKPDHVPFYLSMVDGLEDRAIVSGILTLSSGTEW